MPDERPPQGERFAPRASRELASMFDDVSDRYDLLNRVLSLGRDAAWRRAMWRCVPEASATVLDLCTGNGSSLTGLRRAGRLVVGIDASLGMLEHAAAEHDRGGWSPRLVCADAFHLPLAGQAVDCVTIAFGVRNLRPRREALAEIGRCLKPGGTLVVLEATAPAGGAFAPVHRFYLRRLVPLAGRLSPDPSAYVYLSQSIEEFGSGPEFEADLAACGFSLAHRRSFFLGATGLWAARRRPAGAAAGEGGGLQSARLGELARGEMPNADRRAQAEWRAWTGVQLALSLALVVALGYALWTFLTGGAPPSLEPWQRSGMRALLVLGLAGFLIRTVVLALRMLGPPPRR